MTFVFEELRRFVRKNKNENAKKKLFEERFVTHRNCINFSG